MSIQTEVLGNRRFSLERRTRETQIVASLNLDGSGQSSVNTGIPFLDHMIDQIARHGHMDIEMSVKGGLEVDLHHSAEDAGLVFGELVDRCLGDRVGITRFGHFFTPLDESLAHVVIDLSGRPYLVWDLPFERGERVGNMDPDLIMDFFQAVAVSSRSTIHGRILYGRNLHHKIEAIFKAFARCLQMAVALDPRQKSIPSTKGTL